MEGCTFAEAFAYRPLGFVAQRRCESSSTRSILVVSQKVSAPVQIKACVLSGDSSITVCGLGGLKIAVTTAIG